ncbi:MAG: hypothetical protein IKT78_02870 [Ruminiclostridium sp.]|nr:hypothetical protein [Ruminiclostridium sp.]
MNRKARKYTIINYVFSAIIWLQILSMISSLVGINRLTLVGLKIFILGLAFYEIFTLIASLQCYMEEDQGKYLKLNVIAISITVILIIAFISYRLIFNLDYSFIFRDRSHLI